MAEKLLLLFPLLFLPMVHTISNCRGPCQTVNDCWGKLICTNGKCSDDPFVRPSICSSPILAPPSGVARPPTPRARPPPPAVRCNQSGALICNGITYLTYNCSPLVTNNAPAILTHHNFSKDGASECDEQLHQNTEFVVALFTGWYSGGSRCGKMIRISANGKTTTAKVVGECDSMHGCDLEHAFQPPCRSNIVEASDAVWNALGLNIDVGQVDITWSMV